MAKLYANVNPSFDTFATWVAKTNNLFNDMSNIIVTVDYSTNGAVTTGNAFVNGYLTAVTLIANTALRGGTATTVANLNIQSAVYSVNTATFSAGYYSALLTVGNTSVNTYANSTHFFSGNATYYGFGNSVADVLVSPQGQAALSATNLIFTATGSYVQVGNATVYSTVNSTAFSGLAAGLISSLAFTVNGDITGTMSSNNLQLTLNTIPTLTSGQYGSTTLTPVITVDAKGRVTNVYTVTTTGSGGGGSGNTTNSITFNASGTGAASGNTFNGGAAVTISYNTIGAYPLSGNPLNFANATNGIAVGGTVANAAVAGTLGQGANLAIPMTFNYTYTAGLQPTYLWGAANGTITNVYAASALNVNSAAYATNSGQLNGQSASYYQVASSYLSAINQNLGTTNSPSFTGLTVSGTITGSVNGNAGTVTNGVYTSGSYSQPAWLTSILGSIVSGNIPGNASNITSYTINQNFGTGNSPTFAGLSIGSATMTGNITGNAGTVTNGVYTSGSYSQPAWLTSIAGSIVSGNISGSASNITSYTINQNVGTGNSPTFAGLYTTSQYNAQGNQGSGLATSTGSLGGITVQGPGSGGGAFISFLRPTLYGAYFGLDTDNNWKVGGWSMGAAAYILLHSGNYTSYSPTLTGGGASGTWGINITGSAGSATSATSAGYATYAGYVPNSLTFNNGGSGSGSGTTYNGSGAATISYNTVGAPSATGGGASGTWNINITGNASTATTAGTITGTYSGSLTSSQVTTALGSTPISSPITGGGTTSGWVSLGGLYLQWGTISSFYISGSGTTAVSYSTTFPNAVMNVTVSMIYPSSGYQVIVYPEGTPSTSGFTLGQSAWSSGGQGNYVNVYWQAIGR